MITPSIHLNGTSREDLIEQLLNASEAVHAAMAALQQAAPNGRDYYPQGNDAIGKAMTEHAARFCRLNSVRAELIQIAEAIS